MVGKLPALAGQRSHDKGKALRDTETVHSSADGPSVGLARFHGIAADPGERWRWLACGVFAVALIVAWAYAARVPSVEAIAVAALPCLAAIAFVSRRPPRYALLLWAVPVAWVGIVFARSGLVAALITALVGFPLGIALRALFLRALYGDRGAALRVATRVGDRLTDLSASLDEIRGALRLPYVAVTADGDVLATAGEVAERSVTRPLGNGAELIIGLRRREKDLSPANSAVLDLLSGPLGVAVHATLTTRDLQHSRERLVAAREDERQRLRRDLHDGLGPLLTGVALAADAAGNLVPSVPDQALDLIRGVRADTRNAIAEVRRVVEDLSPHAVHEHGLAEALRGHAARTTTRADGTPLQVTLDVVPLPALAPAVETAAYRIATEALTNVVRHSQATTASIRIRHDERGLTIAVEDNGVTSGAWRPGVGLTAMRERASELQGSCTIGPTDSGGRVLVVLPLGMP